MLLLILLLLNLFNAALQELEDGGGTAGVAVVEPEIVDQGKQVIIDDNGNTRLVRRHVLNSFSSYYARVLTFCQANEVRNTKNENRTKVEKPLDRF